MSPEDILTAMDWEADHQEDRIVLISEIWLDHASHMTKLEGILSGQPSASPVQSLMSAATLRVHVVFCKPGYLWV